MSNGCCPNCGHLDGYHLTNMFCADERKCFYDECDCEYQEIPVTVDP